MAKINKPTPDQAAPGLVFGQPLPCPECGNPGFLDHIDLTNRVMDQHCTQCGYAWQTDEKALQS